MKLALRYALRQLVTRARRGLAARGLILMYHRVSNVEVDPWSMCVSPAHFAEHLQCLSAHFNVLPLQEFVAALRHDKLPPRAVAITFDDGYADNFHQALPLLEKYALPATFFIATGEISHRQPDSALEFWWDEVAKHILEPATLPTTLVLKIRNEQHTWQLESEKGKMVAREQPWLPQSHVAGTPLARLDLYYDLWRQLYPLPAAVREQTLEELAVWSGQDRQARASHRQMTIDELRCFAKSELVEIGGHTITHPALSMQPLCVQADEIHTNKRTLEEWLARPLVAFSYPHGEYNGDTIQLLRAAGYQIACTTDAQPAWRGDGCFTLPRYWIGKWDGATFAAQLAQWLR